MPLTPDIIFTLFSYQISFIYLLCLDRLSRELSPNVSNASTAAAVAGVAALQSSQQQSTQLHRPQALSSHGMSPFPPSHIRSRSTSPPSKHILASPNQSHGQMSIPPRSPPSASPSSLERKFEPDEDVDVEQCSDGEDENASSGDTKHSSNGHPESRSPGEHSSTNNNEERSSGRENSSSTSNPPKKKEKEKVRIMKAKCNCEELKYVDCFLETKELWDKFNELGTEMIITKTGR